MKKLISVCAAILLVASSLSYAEKVKEIAKETLRDMMKETMWDYYVKTSGEGYSIEILCISGGGHACNIPRN